jgi:hypothetical protein
VYAWQHWSKHFDIVAYRAFAAEQRAFAKRLAKAEKLNRELSKAVAA